MSKSDNSDKKVMNTSDKKNYVSKPCWFALNNFECNKVGCTYNHNADFIKKAKENRDLEVCRLYRKCDKKCNKYHNMDELMELYKNLNNKMEGIKLLVD